MKPSEWIRARTRELDEASIAVRPIEHWRTIAIAEWLDQHFELLEEQLEKRDTEPRPPCFPSVMAPGALDGALAPGALDGALAPGALDGAHAETALHVTGPEPLGVPSGANGPSEAEMNNKKAFVIMQSVAALAGVAGVLPDVVRPSSGRRRETIDDVLLRARARRGKAAFDPKLDGRVRGK